MPKMLSKEDLKAAGLSDSQVDAVVAKQTELSAADDAAEAEAKAKSDADAAKAKADADADAAKVKADADKVPETVTLSQSKWAEVEASLARADALAAELDARDRAACLSEAVGQGKIAPAEVAAYAELSTEMVKSVLAKLTPGKVPVGELGSGKDVGKTELSDADYAPTAALFGLR